MAKKKLFFNNHKDHARGKPNKVEIVITMPKLIPPIKKRILY